MSDKIKPNPIYFSDEPVIEVVEENGLDSRIDSILSRLGADAVSSDKEFQYLRKPAPNIIEWVTSVEYWNVPSTFQYWGQYRILRDFFNLRCRVCNSQHPDKVDCWGKSRAYLESEVLLVWSSEYQDFVCPKCGTTMQEFISDGIVIPYNELVTIIGMRGGKSYTGAHIGGYLEHIAVTLGIEKPGALQRRLGQEKSETFELNFVASTEKQAKKTIYAKFRQMRRNSPYMNRYMNWVKRKEKAQIGVEDPWRYAVTEEEISDGYLQLRLNKLSSDSAGIAGATRLGAFLDEWARLIDTEGTRSAQELHRVLNAGLKTIRTAAMLDPTIPFFLGSLIGITSAVAADDPAMQTYEKAKRGILKKTYAVKKATWEFNPFQPRSAFDEEFERDAVAADRDFGSNPPAAATPFIEDKLRLWKAIDWEKKPIATFINTYPSDPTGRDYVGVDLGHCKLDAVNSHYIFGDAGLSLDTFSLACGHARWISIRDLEGGLDDDGSVIDTSGRIMPMGQENVIWPEEIGTFVRPDRGADAEFLDRAQHERVRMLRYGSATPISGRPYEHKDEVLCTEVDFCVRIIPEEGRNVWFDSIINIIEKLHRQIKIGTVCFDRWNSVSTIQQIRSMGIHSYEVTLKIDDFLKFRDMVYNGRVLMLPPEDDDLVNVDEDGSLHMGVPQEHMSAHGVALVEMMKLSRSPDLKRVYNMHKGKVRGRDSDDIARCVIGLHHIIQSSIVDEQANQRKKKNVRKRLAANDNPMSGNIYRGRGNS